jgi:hypothetical protein
VLAKDDGAVTAEFMLLFPALISVVALLLGGFQLGLSAIALERTAGELARQHGYGFALPKIEDYEITTEVSQHLSCVELRQDGLIPLRSKQCVIRAGT